MNLLLITFAFPPAAGVGVLRAHSFAKYLPEHDIHVEVLTTRNTPSVAKDASLLKDLPASVVIHRTPTLDLPFPLRKRIKRLMAGRKSAATSERRASLLGTFIAKAKRTVGDLLLPDPQIGWHPFAIRAARKIIAQRHIDVVLVTVPPFSTAKIVTALRKLYPDLPIILDFRDEWIDSTLNLWSFNATEKAKRVAHSVEQEAVHAATRVIAVTQAALRALTNRYPGEPSEKFLYLSNGFDTRADGGQTPEPLNAVVNDRITLTYIGSLYGSTDPSSLLDGLALLPKATSARLRLRFIGHIEEPAFRERLELLGSMVELCGFLPQSQALAYMRSTDYLLLISHDPINVSAKFYDYLGGGKPILGLVRPDGDIRMLMEKVGAGIWVDSADPVAIAGILERIVSGNVTKVILDANLVMQYRRVVLAEKLAHVCRDLWTNSL